MKDIKKLKPSKSSRYDQGYIDPKSCKKIFESQKNKPIIYRSSYEKKVIMWLETNKNVERWSSESVCIPYNIPGDSKTHYYWPDYLVQLTDKTIILVEVKPLSQTKAPSKVYDKNSTVYNTYIKNYYKWKAAKEFCEKNNFLFKIITEKTINLL